MKILNHLTMLGCLLGSSGLLFAQDDIAPETVRPKKVSPHFNLGPVIDLTLGDIYSPNLQKSMDAQRIIDPHITSWTSTVKPEGGVGFGVFGDWKLNESFHLFTEITFHTQFSRFEMTYQNAVMNPNGNNRFINVNSEFKLNTHYFNIPVLAKYVFGEGKGVSVMGGFGLNLVTGASMMSNETRTTDHYSNFQLSERTVDVSAMTAFMDGFGTARLSAILGAGYQFPIAGHDLELSLRCSLPLTRSGYYTTDVFYENNAFENGQIFGAVGKNSAESEAPQFLLNDFRLITFGISASYGLFSK